MKVANLTVRFACELGALIAFVWAGWPVVGPVLALAVAVFWGAYVGPKSQRRLRDPVRFLAELVIFAAATVAYLALGEAVLAACFAAAALVTALLVRVWPEPVVTDR